MRRRAPLDLSGGRPTTNTELATACGLVGSSGVVPVLSALLDAPVGRHRTIGVRGLLVALQLNALARHHEGHLVEAARAMNALSARQRGVLGLQDHDPAQTYNRLDRLFNRLCGVLEAGRIVDGLRAEAVWLANALAAASVPAHFRRSASLAIDGTDVETWGALHGDPSSVKREPEQTRRGSAWSGEGCRSGPSLSTR